MTIEDLVDYCEKSLLMDELIRWDIGEEVDGL